MDISLEALGLDLESDLESDPDESEARESDGHGRGIGRAGCGCMQPPSEITYEITGQPAAVPRISAMSSARDQQHTAPQRSSRRGDELPAEAAGCFHAARAVLQDELRILVEEARTRREEEEEALSRAESER